ncbi:hypothetical protein SAMN05444394_2498 [Algoriphagus halophilus]|uniref:Uncharacterized protein n=1 Tax=Algoriphagus halophilus TaxID=226505 RepID=A0A1N6FJK5_9BACT|nr:hypothetical protein SAMN05444394_2498 [Algoriphagus halophilus]
MGSNEVASRWEAVLKFFLDLKWLNEEKGISILKT